MDVACCHLIDRPQSALQLSCHRTLQFFKNILIKQEWFSLSSNAVISLENLLNVLICDMHTTVKKYLHVLVLDYTSVAVSGKVNHTSWVAVLIPTDRPKSVCNCCVIKLFVAFLYGQFAPLTFLLVPFLS